MTRLIGYPVTFRSWERLTSLSDSQSRRLLCKYRKWSPFMSHLLILWLALWVLNTTDNRAVPRWALIAHFLVCINEVRNYGRWCEEWLWPRPCENSDRVLIYWLVMRGEAASAPNYLMVHHFRKSEMKRRMEGVTKLLCDSQSRITKRSEIKMMSLLLYSDHDKNMIFVLMIVLKPLQYRILFSTVSSSDLAWRPPSPARVSSLTLPQSTESPTRMNR